MASPTPPPPPAPAHRFWSMPDLLLHFALLCSWFELVAFATVSKATRIHAQHEAKLRCFLVVNAVLTVFGLKPREFFDVLADYDAALVGSHSCRILSLRGTNIDTLDDLRRISVVVPLRKGEDLIQRLKRHGILNWTMVPSDKRVGGDKSVGWVREASIGEGDDVSQPFSILSVSSLTPL
jgi:hypothetical protein